MIHKSSRLWRNLLKNYLQINPVAANANLKVLFRDENSVLGHIQERNLFGKRKEAGYCESEDHNPCLKKNKDKQSRKPAMKSKQNENKCTNRCTNKNVREENGNDCPDKCCPKYCRISDPCCPDPCAKKKCPPEADNCCNKRSCCPTEIFIAGGCCEPDKPPKPLKRCERAGACDDPCCPSKPKCPDLCEKKDPCEKEEECFKKRSCPPDDRDLGEDRKEEVEDCQWKKWPIPCEKDECERRYNDPCAKKKKPVTCNECLELDPNWPPERSHCRKPKRDPCTPCQRRCVKKTPFNDGLC